LEKPQTLEKPMGIRNSTTTFAQSWSSTQGRLVRVEVFVLFSALIWILVELLGSRRRRHSHEFFRCFVWAVYTLFTVLGPYTIGLLQDGPFRDQTFVLWGSILLLIQVSADSLSVYSIHDIEQRKRVLVQHVLQIVLVLWLIVNSKGHNTCYTATVWIFWIQSVILTYRKSAVLSNASKKGGLLKQSKVVADYMMIEHKLILPDVAPNPKTMEGYRYIFHGEEEVASLLPTAPEYRQGPGTKCTTIDSVWRWIEGQDVLTTGAVETIKDVALSFSLFKLLKRRLCGYRIGEAGRAKTLDFVLYGLISEEGNYGRAFAVIEDELAFLYDFLYTRYDTKNYMFWFLTFVNVVVTVTVWNSISGAFSRHYHRSNLEQRVHGTDVTRWVTIVLLIIVLVLSFLPPTMDRRWEIVDELHSHKQPTWETAMSQLSRNGRSEILWQRAFGQYSLLLDFDYHSWNVLPLLSLGLVDKTREGQKAGRKTMLTREIIERVLSGFKESNGQLHDGQSALARNQLLSQFSWACTLPTNIHNILVWHIGTTIAMDGHPVPRTGDHRVAKTLSDYCAYLVAFVPDMLPGHGYDTQRIFDAVVMEARKSLTGCDTVSSRCEKLTMMALASDSSGTILELGGRLGRELRGVVPEARRWKVLADFWAEFILFLAPSSNVEIHAEKLAAGGEFMTHLWALLTHAGILERPSTTDGAGGGNNGAPARDSPV
jgi:hypothetical protein